MCIFEDNKDKRTGKRCSLVTRTPRDTAGGTAPGVGKCRRATESPTGFLDIREAQLINSQHLVRSPEDSTGEKSMDARFRPSGY